MADVIVQRKPGGHRLTFVAVGVTVGVAIGGFFAGESMFHRVSDASKVALYYLVEHLRQRGFVLFDIQMVTPVTERLGARTITREEYLGRLKPAIRLPRSFRPERIP
jgi:leucyl/phenylalanyl-tRNA--protein transferase